MGSVVCTTGALAAQEALGPLPRPPSKLESEESDDLFTQEGAVSEACRDEADSGEAKQVDRKRGE